ncbi:hypothetical protein [Giesbergeria anulus]|uniref:DUF2059 domain-containing protein n=1 Tax=Giesbergeria anulus TaxID=180197 RepID=A0A1H9RGL6_9BURK|nr:hypothetical protein [Giesbergeria anulus]SER71695.1 hypothetical protein SAMN02982919_02862 [Giesbergeria anulus]
MLPNFKKMGLTALLATILTTQAETFPEVPTPSTTEMLVQSMGFAAEFKAQAQRMQSLPQHAEKNSPHVLTLEKKIISLSETALGGAIARALETGLSASDKALIAAHYQSSLGKKMTLLGEQAQAAAAADKKVSATVRLAALLQTLSPDERRALEKFAATGATERFVKLLESETFDHAFRREIDALPVTGQ